jgi:hypothetical protein
MLACCGVSLLHIGAGAIASLALGYLWYSPFMFGSCSKESSACAPGSECSNTTAMFLEFLNSSVATWALLTVLALLDPENLNQGLYFGYLISLATTIPSAISDHIWKGQSISRTLINAGHAVAWTSMIIALRMFI